MSRLSQLLKIRYHYENVLDQQQGQGLYGIVWINLILILLYGLYWALFDPTASAAGFIIAPIALIALGLIAVLVLLNRGHLQASKLIYVAMLFGIVSVNYLVNRSNENLIPLSIPLTAAGVLFERRGLNAMVGLTLLVLVGGSMLRELDITTNPAAFITPLETVLLSAVTLIANGAILGLLSGGQRILLENNLHLTRELRSSTQVAQIVSEVQSVDEMLIQSVDLIRDRLGYYHIQIFLLDETTRALVLRAATATLLARSDTARRRILPEDPTPINQVFRSSKTQRITRADPVAQRVEFLGATRSELVLPLVYGKNTLGVLDIHSIDSTSFVEHDIEILTAIAEQLSMALQNMRLFSAIQDFSQTREQQSEQLHQARLEIETLKRELSGYVWTRYLRGQEVLGFDWEGGKVAFNTAPSTDLERAVNTAKPEIRVENGEQIMSVPIIVQGLAIGAMEFRTSDTQHWDENSLELTLVAGQRLASDLETARLYEQAQSIADREQMASQVTAYLQSYTEIDSLLRAAARSFQEALGATRSSVHLGLPDEVAPHQNGGHA